MNRLTCRPWWLIGLLLCSGCAFLMQQPQRPPPPKARGERGPEEKAKRDVATRERARAAGWDVRYPDLSPRDPAMEAEAARAEPKVSTGASGWELRSPNLDPQAPPSAAKGRASGWEVGWPSLSLKEERAPAGPQAAAAPSTLIQTSPGPLRHRGAMLLDVLLLLYNNVANGAIGIGFGARDYLDFSFIIGGGDIGKGGFISGFNFRFPFLQGMLKPFAQLSLLGGYSDSLEGYGSFTGGVGLQVDFSQSVGFVLGLDFGVLFGNKKAGFGENFLFAFSLGPQFRF